MNDTRLAFTSSPREHAPLAAAPVKMSARGMDFYYDRFHAVKNINFDIPEKQVTALIGPSGCGKSTLLRVVQSLYALYPNGRPREVLLDGHNISPKFRSPPASKVGMVFQDRSRSR